MSDIGRVALPTGVELCVETFGADRGGTPLVVIHGGPSWSHDYLNPGLALVGERRRVVAPDLRGCGRSSRDLPMAAYQPELAVADVIALIETLGHGPVDLLGFSTGGQWAQLLVAARPDLVRRLILASTTADADFAAELDANPEVRRRRALPPVVPEGDDDLARTVAWALNDAPLAIADLRRLAEYRAFLTERVLFSPDWLAPFEQGLLHPHRPADPPAVLRAFGRPILILHGRQDYGFPVSVATRLAAAVPAAVLVVIDDCGHQAPFEQPAAWARAVVEFLARPADDGEKRPGRV